MIEKGNLNEFKWIKNEIKPIISSSDEEYIGNTVGNLLPNNFSRYIKTLCPKYIFICK